MNFYFYCSGAFRSYMEIELFDMHDVDCRYKLSVLVLVFSIFNNSLRSGVDLINK